MRDAFDCVSPFDNPPCAEPHYDPVVNFDFDFETGADGRMFGGRVELFIRLNLLFFKPEAKAAIVRWKGRSFDLVPQIDESFSFAVNPGLWCNTILFGPNHPACGT
ncbi:MAG TPA: hypothetical protein RMG48_14635 [Myxococcales bacterium LLY-WYZ-16_1]|nr:hypothetical protein [Myxococcales bacterium LLY-WYZ-16_1]